MHRWNLTPRRAIALQRALAGRVVERPLGDVPRLIAGGDAAFLDGGDTIVAGWVVWDRVERRVIEEAFVRRPARFPYVPGLLSFREAPALLAAARRLRSEPGLFLIDGHGLAHPRRFGIACHVGLLLGKPTRGCAKGRLCGEHDTPEAPAGSRAALRDDGATIGAVVRLADAVRPVYVSIGHLITLDDAVRAVQAGAIGYRLPEPTRLADQAVGRAKRMGSIVKANQ